MDLEELKNENSSLSPSELLKEVNNAIKVVASTGVSYKIGSRSIQRSSLGELKNLRAELAAEIATAENNGDLFARTYLANFEGR